MPASATKKTGLSLDSPVAQLWGVGPERAAQLARLQIRTVRDLLLHAPNRYEDRRCFVAIRDLRLREPATTRGRIVAQGIKTYQKRTRSVFEFVLDDGTARLHCRWWNMPFLENHFAVGQELLVYGKPIWLKPRTMDHPEAEIVESGDEASLHLDRIVPVYPLTEGLPQRALRTLIGRTLDLCAAQFAEAWPQLARDLADWPTRTEAIRQLHFPKELRDAERARERLALDEFVALQLDIQRRRRHLQTHARGLPCGGDNRFNRPFLQQLGFGLTGAQTRVLRELRRDLSGAHPMRRLLQGDVGAGKTVVAACCALMTMESAFNVVLMAPTEILAEQHFATFSRWFEPLGLNVELQTGSRKTVVERAPSHQRRGAPTVVIGTHALIEPTFQLDRIGLVIIDEQHKFGVTQREELLRKGTYPHLLVMTATPIPRTLGLTLYGDLDVSVLDELPPGRGRIKTFVRTTASLPKVWDFVRQKLGEGRQAYVIYPRVEDTSAPQASVKAVTQELERVEKNVSPHRVGMLHGRLSPDAKEALMSGFRGGDVRVLVSTSVIEVGVDVANATVMLVENAEQFGLAQLHQLRGRIGRSGHDAYCILVTDHDTPEIRERLRVLEQTTDGFEIAEADLKLRGPGELLGQAQSGEAPFRFGDLHRDAELIEKARKWATKLVAEK